MINLHLFHSPITKQKLSLIKPENPCIPYSSYEEINTKFKEFSNKTKDQEDSSPNKIESRPNKTSPKSILRRASLTPNFQRKATQRISIKLDFDVLKAPLGENVDISSAVKEEYERNREQMMHGEIHPVVKFFGNMLIGSVFQALLVKCIEEVYALKSEDSSAMSSKVLHYFGISTIHLKMLKTQEAKRLYIIKCMNAKIDNLLKSWKEKIEFQEKAHAQGLKEYEALKIKNNEEMRDRFPWLTLKTKYLSLQKKLKAVIIQKLNDYENQIGVIETLNKRQSIGKSMTKFSHDELKVTLRDVSPPKTTSLINNSCKTEPQETSSQTSSNLKKVRAKTIKNYSIDTRVSTATSSKNLKTDKSLTQLTPQINRIFEKEGLADSGLSFKIKDKEIEWDDDFEQKFKKYMAQGRKLFFNEMKNAKFYEIGVMYMIQELFKEEKKNLERAECLNNYAEGNYLDADELKFLADTSDLMNSCVDKSYIKKVVGLIDPNILHYIELNLAESIILKYKEMREIIVTARNKFIQQNNVTLKKKLNDFEANIARKQQMALLSKSRRNFSRSIRCVIKKVTDKQERYEQSFQNSVLLSPKKEFNFDEKLEAYKNMNPYKKSRMNNKSLKGYCLPKEIDIYSNPDHPNVVRHKYHPSSKVFTSIPVENSEEKDLKTVFGQDDASSFKLLIKSPESLKSKENFIKFYSGGPSQTVDEPLFNYSTGLRQPTPFELKAIIRVQRRARGFIARNRFKALLAQHQLDNFAKFQEKVKSIKNQRSQSPKLSKAPSQSERIENLNETREMKIINKSPPKTLLLKHRKLLEATKTNNIFMARNSGFVYYANDMNVKDKQGNVPLYYAAKNANLEFCSYLMESGAKVNERCEEGNTPFHIAFLTNRLEIIMMMLDNGGDLNNTNDHGQTPLAFASLTTLKKLDLENGIATITNSATQAFNNNKLLAPKTVAQAFKTNEFCDFRMEKLIDPSDKVRASDPIAHATHLVSFNAKITEKQEPKDSRAQIQEIMISTLLKEKDIGFPASSPSKKKRP